MHLHEVARASDAVELNTALATPDTDSDLGLYLRLLGVDAGELGSPILDLGSSKTLTFATEMAKLGKRVISLSPKYIIDSERPRLPLTHKGLTEPLGFCLAALAQELPFRDGCFETVVAVGSIPMYLPRKAYKGTLEEVIRVTKPRGSAFIGPIYEFSESNFSERLFFEAIKGVKGADISIVDMKSQGGTSYKILRVNKFQ
ncbi:MAG TPA: class I SAM-dependent methyltransferase [Candidatus Saccharibacteria bacterium]|nr:class I SAM-dependent methyltransferase [Candidatus Saccharibacteria bacterium]